MKIETVYVSRDGIRFLDHDACVEYERRWYRHEPLVSEKEWEFIDSILKGKTVMPTALSQPLMDRLQAEIVVRKYTIGRKR